MFANVSDFWRAFCTARPQPLESAAAELAAQLAVELAALL